MQYSGTKCRIIRDEMMHIFAYNLNFAGKKVNDWMK
jgi:hypothetical protein